MPDSNIRLQLEIAEVSNLPASSGIYAIVNRLDGGKRYVGKALNLRERMKTHIFDLRRGLESTNSDRCLQRAWDEFGEGAFCIEILEFCLDNEHKTAYAVRPDNLSLAEHYYINQRAEYNKDIFIVSERFWPLVNRFAWREPIDAEIQAKIDAAVPHAYIVGTRLDFANAVLVSAHNEAAAKEKARTFSTELKTLGKNLSSRRLGKAALLEAKAAGLPDLTDP